MQTEPKPEAIAEDFVQFFQNTVAELESASVSEQQSSETPDATANAPETSEAEPSADAAPTIDLEQIIALAMGRIPDELAESNEVSESAKPAETAPAEAESNEKTQPSESVRETQTKRTKPEPDEDADEDEETTDEDDEGDWLSQLFKPRGKPNLTEEPEAEESPPTTKQKQPTKPKSELESKIAELEQRVKVAEEVAQQVVMATTLRLWVEQAKQESQAFQNVVRQHGIELSDQDVEDAMVRALGQIQQNPNALYQELAAKALQAMAKEYSKAMRLPAQYQTTQTRPSSNEPRTFEDYLELALRESSDRR